MLSSYVFDIRSAHFRNAIHLAETSGYFCSPPVCVLGKRCRDEDDEGECSWKRRCIRPPFWSFNEFWVDSESEDESEWVDDKDIPKISLELEDSDDELSFVDVAGPISPVPIC